MSKERVVSRVVRNREKERRIEGEGDRERWMYNNEGAKCRIKYNILWDNHQRMPRPYLLIKI